MISSAEVNVAEAVVPATRAKRQAKLRIMMGKCGINHEEAFKVLCICLRTEPLTKTTP